VGATANDWFILSRSYGVAHITAYIGTGATHRVASLPLGGIMLCMACALVRLLSDSYVISL
jgi:hypothetical protein